MNAEFIREYCIGKKGVTESFPFDEHTLVFKVCNKMFALLDLELDLRINLKCNPEKAMDYRSRYQAIIPGYHMNKKHWNTVNIDGSLANDFVLQMIDDSYKLVVNSLPGHERKGLLKKGSE